jgi:hypothetical protein
MASEHLFTDIPAFPDDVPIASMTTVPLESLRSQDGTAAEALLGACRELGFFLLDLGSDETGKLLIEIIDQLFVACKETMNLSGEVKREYQHDFPRSFLG